MLQDENGPRTFVIRANVPPTTIIAPARAILADLDRRVAINAVRPMTEVRDAALAKRKFVMMLVLTFAAAGLLLALVGVYGVMAQLARGRRREVGAGVAVAASLPTRGARHESIQRKHCEPSDLRVLSDRPAGERPARSSWQVVTTGW